MKSNWARCAAMLMGLAHTPFAAAQDVSAAPPVELPAAAAPVKPVEAPPASAPAKPVYRNPIDAVAQAAALEAPPSIAAQTAAAPAPCDGGCPGKGACHQSRFTPFMLGDFSGPIANLFSEVKIAEGESPRPMDRVFHKSNYYNNLNKSRWADPTEPIHNVELLRNTIGFEKSFSDQSWSLGMRIPFNTISADGKDVFLAPDPSTGRVLPVFGEPDFTTTLLGNISAIAKVVLWENRDTGSLISGGATLSFPTASNKKIDPGISTVMFMQPYVGYILGGENLFVQGFSSMTVPILSAESIVMFNDIGIGYWLKRDGQGFISGIAPTMEFHLATPLRQIDTSSTVIGPVDGLRVFDVLNMTMGATLVLRNNATLGFGMCVPLTGPKPFDIEAISQFNYRF